jgi:hypothetical protein
MLIATGVHSRELSEVFKPQEIVGIVRQRVRMWVFI